jgi:hypothetical protein
LHRLSMKSMAEDSTIAISAIHFMRETLGA